MKKLPKTPEWAIWETVLEGVEKMQPVTDALRKELLAGQKAKREGKPKRLAYHMRRIVNILFNLDYFFWHPMFEWAQTEEFQRAFQGKLRRRKARAKK